MAKVLLVEDDNNLREIYQARLMAEGYDIVTAQNGEEALVVAKQNKPDLIISDVMMPRISGFEMLDILRNTAELKNTKVIMLTALGQAEDQARANSLGADKYLVKSQVTLEDIVNTAKQLLDDGNGVAASSSSMTTPAPAPTTTPPAPSPAPVVAPAASPVASAPEPAPAPIATPPAPPLPAVASPAPVAPQADTAVAVTPAPAEPAAPATSVISMPPTEPTSSAPAEPATPSTSVVTAANVDTPTAPPVAVTPEPADVPVVPAPAPEPAEATTPGDASATLAAPATAVSNSVPQSMEAEEAALQAQIDNFAKEPAVPTPEVTPTETPAEAIAAANDNTLQTAVTELGQPATTEATPAAPVVPATPPEAASPVALAPEPAPAPMATPPTPPLPAIATPETPTAPEPASSSNNVVVAGKKIIQPISTPGGNPNLNDLLAKEEAKDAANTSAPTVPAASTVAPAPTPETPPAPPLPTAGLDPKTVAL